MANPRSNDNIENVTQYCWWYNAFGDCAGGCEKKHDGVVTKQTFFYAQIDKISTSMTLLCLSGKKKKFFVGNHFWHSSRAVEGDYVLFQASKQKHRGGTRLGRVAFVIRKTNPSPSILGKVDAILPQVEVFTLDPDGTILHDDAYSIEECTEKDCKFIGIHISAFALQGGCQIGAEGIPCFPNIYFSKTSFSLDKGKVALALSVYFHTECESGCKTHGPVLTQVHVADNYTYSRFKQYKKQLAYLWRYFAKPSVFNERKIRYITRYPMTWRQRYVIEEMMMKFQSVVKKKPSGCFITQGLKCPYDVEKNNEPAQDKTDNELDTVIVSKKIYDNFMEERTKSKLNDSSILAFVASGLRSTESAPFKSTPKWVCQYDVHSLTTSTANTVPCTSPGRKVVHYVNQQIILNGLFRNSPLYTSEDLLGILGIRFRASSLVTVVVTAVHGSSFDIRYVDVQGLTPKLKDVSYKTFTGNPIELERKIKIVLKVFCNEKDYCNQDLVRLSSKALQSVLDDMQKRDSVKGDFCVDLSKGEPIERSPYEEHKDGTQLVIEPGAELHLQISHQDARDENGFGLRFLKIGIGCHLCVTHIHHSYRAFRSDRRDVCELISPKSIKELQAATVEQKMTDSITVRGVQIKWKSIYYSGGSFRTKENLTKGDLLCVRKESWSAGSEYVWCCHGVVSSVEGQDVTFEVCSLMQPESVPNGNDFYVEIVKRQIDLST